MLTWSDIRWWEWLERLWGLVVGRSRNERRTGGGRSKRVMHRNEFRFGNWSWSRSESWLSRRSWLELCGSWSWARSEDLRLRGSRLEWCGSRSRCEGLLRDRRFEWLRSWSWSWSEDRLGWRLHGWWWSLDRLRSREGFGWLVRLVLHALRVLLLRQVRSLQLVRR